MRNAVATTIDVSERLGGLPEAAAPVRSANASLVTRPFQFPLPAGHRFPLAKYRLLRERVVADGLVAAADVREPEAIAWSHLELVHDRALLERIRTGAMTAREQRAVGIPWSPALTERARRATQSTVEAARDARRRASA